MIKPARIRFDDAIVTSSDSKIKGKEVQKFLKNVRWCQETGVLLTPAILCQDTEKLPGAIEALQELNKNENIQLDLHGWDHGPYGSRSQKEIEEHLDKALNWFEEHFETLPVRWVTPHGADSAEIRSAASKYDLVVETTGFPVVDQAILDVQLRKTKDISILKNCIVMNHFYKKGFRLYRIAKIIQYQGVIEAIEGTKSELDKKSHRICWGEWI